MPLKILIGVSSTPSRTGGISTYSKILAKALSNHGHHVYYLCPITTNKEWFSYNSIPYFFVSEIESQVNEAQRTYNFIRKNQFDIIINNDNSILQSIAPLVNSCFISICHMESRAIASLACANSSWCDYIVAISYDMYDSLIYKSKLNFTRVPIIFNGITIDQDEQKILSKNSDSQKPLRCIFSGHYSKHKGGDLFLKYLLSNKIPDNTEYYWYGDVPKHISEKLNNLDHVKHIGRVTHDDFIQNLSKSDILIFPSRQEGCPMSVLEAMKFGVVPVVSNGRGAMRHIVTHGQDGFVCNFKSYEQNLSIIIRRLETDRSYFQSISTSAKRTCLTRFSIDSTVEKLLSLGMQPNVDRSSKPTETRIFRWHRPGISISNFKPSLKQRAYYRLGILQEEGILRA
ncbi:MAG: glycosyltransferase family 4 protein [Rickettsiales bacterium]